MKEKIAYALAIGCPLLQALEMIDQMIGDHYRANLHIWNAPEEIIIRNLKATMMDKIRWHGFGIIVDKYFEYFNINDFEED